MKHHFLYCTIISTLFSYVSSTFIPSDICGEKAYADMELDELPREYFWHERRLFPIQQLLDRPDYPFKSFFSGYFRTMTYTDTDQIVGLLENYVFLFPRKKKIDPCGRNINHPGQFDIASREARFIFDLVGPATDNARVRAQISGDFLGDLSSILSQFRVRTAFVGYDWPTTSIKFGQYWHPLNFPIIAPDTVAFIGGAPFNAYGLNPQLRCTFHFPHAHLLFAALTNGGVPAVGPIGFSTRYIRNAIVPNLHAHGLISLQGQAIGAGIDFKRLVPRLASNKGFKVNESLYSFSGIAYLLLNKGKVDIAIKCSYMENYPNLLTIGGYAVHSINPATDQRTYVNLSSISAWTEIVIRQKIEPALFIGVLKNLGASKSIIPKTIRPDGSEETLIYGLGTNVDTSLRIAPRVKAHFSSLQLSAEIEYSATRLGDLDCKGRVINAKPAHNTRFIVSGVFFF